MLQSVFFCDGIEPWLHVATYAKNNVVCSIVAKISRRQAKDQFGVQGRQRLRNVLQIRQVIRCVPALARYHAASWLNQIVQALWQEWHKVRPVKRKRVAQKAFAVPLCRPTKVKVDEIVTQGIAGR